MVDDSLSHLEFQAKREIFLSCEHYKKIVVSPERSKMAAVESQAVPPFPALTQSRDKELYIALITPALQA